MHAEQLATTRVMATREEFEELVTPNLPYFRGLARSLTRTQQDADDLLQESLLKGYLCVHRFERGTNFRGWMTLLMRRLSQTEYARVSKSLDRDSYDSGPVPILYHSRLMEAHDTLDDGLSDEFVIALERLKPKMRDVLVKMDIEWLPRSVISEQCGIPTGTIGSRVYRAREIMREALTEMGVGPGRIVGSRRKRDGKRKQTLGIVEVKSLAHKHSLEELQVMYQALVDDPANRVTAKGSVYLYSYKARKKMDLITWAIRDHLVEQKKREAAKAKEVDA